MMPRPEYGYELDAAPGENVEGYVMIFKANVMPNEEPDDVIVGFVTDLFHFMASEEMDISGILREAAKKWESEQPDAKS